MRGLKWPFQYERKVTWVFASTTRRHYSSAPRASLMKWRRLRNWRAIISYKGKITPFWYFKRSLKRGPFTPTRVPNFQSLLYASILYTPTFEFSQTLSINLPAILFDGPFLFCWLIIHSCRRMQHYARVSGYGVKFTIEKYVISIRWKALREMNFRATAAFTLCTSSFPMSLPSYVSKKLHEADDLTLLVNRGVTYR